MVKFEDLPNANQALILATLGLEIATADCMSIVDLARKRNQTASTIWRDVCKRTGQPHCTMPPRVIADSKVPSPELPKHENK
jgi:hypothetical protein